jgi:hypothetical protein
MLCAAGVDTINAMKQLWAPWSYGLTAARHLAWYVSYQVTGDARRGGEVPPRR